jgi:hypothetical protein
MYDKTSLFLYVMNYMEYQWIFFCIFLNFLFLTCQPSRVHCVKLEPVSSSSRPKSMPEGPTILEATDQTNQPGDLYLIWKDPNVLKIYEMKLRF